MNTHHKKPDGFENDLRLIGENLRRIRKEKKFSQEQLSLKSGISVVTISQIENGQTEATNHVLAALAAHLGRQLSDLFAPPPKSNQ